MLLDSSNALTHAMAQIEQPFLIEGFSISDFGNSYYQTGTFYDCFEEENVIRKAMIKHASKKVFLCDSTKFGKTSLFHLCSLNDVDYIISNHTIPENVKIENYPKIITE